MSLESLISSEPSVPYIWQEGRLWKPWYKEHPTTIFSMNERQRRIITALVYLWVCRCIVGMSVYCPDEVGIGSMPWSSLLSISPVSAIPLCISHGGPSESPGAWGGYHNLSQYFGLIHLTVDGEGERVALVHKMATWKKNWLDTNVTCSHWWSFKISSAPTFWKSMNITTGSAQVSSGQSICWRENYV